MKKVWTLIKAIWILLWTNRELIERHLKYIEQEKEIVASIKEKHASGSGETYTVVDTYDDSMNL